MRLINAADLHEHTLVFFPGGEGIARGEHGLIGGVKEQAAGLGARPALGGAELGEKLRGRHAGEVGLPHRCAAFRRDAPDAAVGAVAPRVGVAGLVVADDGVEPIAQIHGAIRADADIHGAERRVGAGDQAGQLRGLEAAALVLEAVQLDDAAEVAADERAALDLLRQRARADDLQRVRLRAGVEDLSHRVVFIRLAQRDEARRAEVTRGAVAAFVEDLEVVVKSHAPAVVPGFAAIEKALQLQRARVQPPDAGFFQDGQAVRRLHTREGVQALREPQRAVRAVADGVDELVRVANAEAGEKDASLVGAAVAVRVAQMDEAVEVAHIRAARAGLHALHHGESFGEAGAFISDAIVVRVLQHEDEVGGLHTRQRVRVSGGAGHPEAAFFIPGKLHRLHHSLRLGGEKAHLIPLGHREAGELLLRRQHRLRRGLRRHGRGLRRVELPALGDGVDERVMPGDERLVRLEALAQRGRVGGGLAEHLRHAVAIDEGPVRRPPAVEPQAVLFHNGLPQRGQVIRVTGGNPELLADDAPHHAQALGIQMQAVIREARRLRTATGELGEKIHKQRATLPGDLPHGVGIGLHVVISQSQVRRVRRMGRVRLFKRHRRDEHQPRRARAELVQQPVIRRGELRHARLAIEGLHLAELADHHARAHR